MLIISLALVALIGSSCTRDSQVGKEGELELSQPDRVGEEGEFPAVAPEGAGEGGGVAEDQAALAAQTTTDLPGDRVIRTADLSLRVEDGKFNDAFERASSVAAELGGFVASSSTLEGSEDRGRLASGRIVVRIPSESFDDALKRFRDLGEVVDESQEGTDVSAEFLDLEGRLKHLRSQEAFFLRLIDEAETISDLIQIQGQLSNVQLQIEQIQGRINFLKDRTDFATISVSLFEPGEDDEPPNGIGKAWRDALAAFEKVIAGLIVGIGAIAPFAIIGGVIWLIWRNMRRRRAAAQEKSG